MLKRTNDRQWKALEKEEAAYNKRYVTADKQPSKFQSFVSQRIPDKLEETLNIAFAKSFELIFDNATTAIEKSYNKENIEFKYKLNTYAYELKPDKKRVNAFAKEAKKSERKNIAVSTVKGVSLGLLGIGLADIPIFIGMIIKGIYEISLNYGYDYNTPQERYFILNIITCSLLNGEDAVLGDIEINKFIMNNELPQEYKQEEQIKIVSKLLSKELLYMKFVQGIPIVGVLGGVFDAIYVKRILDYAQLKYKRRFLLHQLSNLTEVSGKKAAFGRNGR